MLTQKKLKKLLHYNPETGTFTWININKHKVERNNTEAGTASLGYIAIIIKGKSYLAHRLAWLYMTGEWPKRQIDHVNHIRNDNRWINFREVSHQENHKNRPLQKNNTSGISGVCWNKESKKWQAKVKINQKTVGLGYYIDKFEAICARMSANNKYGFHANHGR